MSNEEHKEGSCDEKRMTVLIRKQDLNLHKYDTRNRNLTTKPAAASKDADDKAFYAQLSAVAVPDYIDELDQEMVRRKQQLDSQNYKQPVPKWMNAAWDAFRIVDNHSKSMIFQMPEDPKHEDWAEYIAKVDKPLSIEHIRVRYMPCW